MNSRYLVCIFDDKKMFFSFEKQDFKISREIGEFQVYSSVFPLFSFKFLDDSFMVNEHELKYDTTTQVEDYQVLVTKNNDYKTYIIEKSIVIGSDPNNCDIIVSDCESVFVNREQSEYVINTNNGVFVNNKKKYGEIVLKAGDFIFIANELIFFTKNGIKIRSHIESMLMPDYSSFAKVNHKSYHRSPRIFHVPDETAIKIESPPAKPTKNEKTLFKLIIPPLIMLSITIGISILIGRGLFIVISITATLMSIIKSVQSFFEGRKKFKEDSENRIIKYREYLTKKSVEINLRIQEEKDGVNYHILSPSKLIELVSNESRRIYEKSTLDTDFLSVRIGIQSRKPTFKIDLAEQKLTQDYDELYEDANEVANNFKNIEGIGLSIDVRNNNVGIIGTKQLSILIVKQILLEVMTLHSYHDVQFLTIFDQKYLKELEWIVYAPHSKIDVINVRGLVYNEVLRDQILGSFVQIIKDREQKFKEDNSTRFSPHYIVPVLSSELIAEHSINEYLDQELHHLGLTVIIVENEIENLKENIKTVIEIYSKRRSRLLIDSGQYVKKHFEIDVLPSNKELLTHARMLKGFNHTLKSENGLPKMITFLEMYQASTINDLQIKSRWQRNDSTKTLAVRLGVNGEDYVELNLHEKAHGPHGLVAGTTGSGKSEIIQSYILSLAINFSPHEVAFLLIDYKGGGMANLFMKLPHLIGTVTNLDGDGSMRALASIKSELLRRQEIFAKYNVNHVNQYIRLFKEGQADEPMPHLFMISDEFAELKSEQPEFMRELVSTARIGRSLGIHLILATQKPSGVVDSQIWSNSKFKLCLKVQDESDSKEMLKTTDAAHIVEPGRAYLQVGNNEIYELFQSAWSGADYYAEKQESHIDKRIYSINRLGQYKLLTTDLSEIESGEKIEKNNSELEEVLNSVESTFNEMGLNKVRPICLEDLETRYYLDDFIEIDFDIEQESVMLGKVDIPNKQTQIIYNRKLSDLGNIAVFGSGGYGKSYTLMTMLFSLFCRNHADKVYSYVLDFGNNSLINLRHLPHVAEYITLDDDEKLKKFIVLINETIIERKKLFAKHGANHISVYNELVEEKFPTIIIALDNFDILKDEFRDLYDYFAILTRDCTSLGIYFMCSASRINAFKISMLNNLKTRVSLYNLDRHEYTNAVGKSQFLPKEVPGNALVKVDGEPAVMQVMMPAKADNDIEMVKTVKAKVEDIAKNYQGKVPPSIAVVSDEIDAEELINSTSLNENELIIGMSYDSVSAEIINYSKVGIIPLLSNPGLGKTNFIKFVLMQSIANGVIIDSSEGMLKSWSDRYEYYTFDDKKDLIERIKNDEFNGKVLICDNAGEFLGIFNAVEQELLAAKFSAGTLKLIIALNVDVIRLYTGAVTKMIKSSTVNILQVNPSDQRVIEFKPAEKPRYVLKAGDVVNIIGTVKRKVKVPNVGGN